jgi:hypothetical protein
MLHIAWPDRCQQRALFLLGYVKGGSIRCTGLLSSLGSVSLLRAEGDLKSPTSISFPLLLVVQV